MRQQWALGASVVAALLTGVMKLISTGAAAMAENPTSAAPQAQMPCLVVWHDDSGDRKKATSGLEMAIWEDGTILLSPRPDKLGEFLLVGRAEKEDLKAALDSIRQSGFIGWKGRRSYQVPDSSSTTIRVFLNNNLTIHAWHESLLPGFGGDINKDAEYREFVRMWKKTRAAIDSIAPAELHRLSDHLKGAKEFRGYNVGTPRDTEWLRKAERR